MPQKVDDLLNGICLKNGEESTARENRGKLRRTRGGGGDGNDSVEKSEYKETSKFSETTGCGMQVYTHTHTHTTVTIQTNVHTQFYRIFVSSENATRKELHIIKRSLHVQSSRKFFHPGLRFIRAILQSNSRHQRTCATNEDKDA